MITLSAEKRTNEKMDALRASEKIPAVYYSKGSAANSISISLKEFIKAFKEAGETSTILLTIGTEKVNVLVHDLQKDPRNNIPTHVDFLVVDMNKPIEVAVPIEFTGLADAEKGGLGNVVKVLHEIEVSGLPANIPHSLVVDITKLATLEDQIHVSDIALPKGVTLVTDATEVVALVSAFVEEVESAPIDLAAIEVEKKGKKEDAEAAE